MPAVSKTTKILSGWLERLRRGKWKIPRLEVAKVAASAKRTDVKKFASTKHDKLPEKKVSKEATDFSQRDKIMKKSETSS